MPSSQLIKLCTWDLKTLLQKCQRIPWHCKADTTPVLCAALKILINSAGKLRPSHSTSKQKTFLSSLNIMTVARTYHRILIRAIDLSNPQDSRQRFHFWRIDFECKAKEHETNACRNGVCFIKFQSITPKHTFPKLGMFSLFSPFSEKVSFSFLRSVCCVRQGIRQ